MLATLRQTSFALSKRAGLMSAVAGSTWRRERLLILCYHGVSLDDEHHWRPGLYVSPQTLARRFEILRRAEAAVLPLDEAIDRLYANDLPPRAVALTFDDGYQDFLRRAYPLLQQYGYAATVYLPTQRVLQNYPIPQLIVSYLLWKHRAGRLDGRGIAGLDTVYDLADEPTRRRIVLALLARFSHDKLSPRGKDAVVRDVAARLGADYDALVDFGLLRLMTAKQVRRLSEAGISFELHTHRHRTPEDPAHFRKEVDDNRRHLEAIIGRRASHFCYPSGVYRASYPAVLKADGVRSATTCDPDLAARTSDALLLPRFVDTEMVSDIEFESWVTGAACWLPRRTRRAHRNVH
jgi:peptidoglycan/xylan/chitin deacetylase (PgdA/CDA1 family)